MAGFSRLRTSTPVTSTPGATAAPAPVTPEPVAAVAPAPAPVVQPVAVTAVAAPASHAVSIPNMTASVLKVVAASAEEGGTFVEVFPTLTIKGGNAGGTVSPSKNTDKSVADVLPQGRMPINGVFMAFRVIAESWPIDFDNRKPEDRPMISCAVGCNDAELAGLLLKGCENFQFCPDKQKWTEAAGGPGLLRPRFELLVYLPQFDDVVVLQNPGLLKSWQTESQILSSLAGPDGSLGAFPCIFKPETKPWYDTNVYHYWGMEVQPNAQGKDWLAKYHAYVSGLPTNRPDMVEAISDWFSCADKPVDANQRRLIEQAASMVNPRRARK